MDIQPLERMSSHPPYLGLNPKCHCQNNRSTNNKNRNGKKTCPQLRRRVSHQHDRALPKLEMLGVRMLLLRPWSRSQTCTLPRHHLSTLVRHGHRSGTMIVVLAAHTCPLASPLPRPLPSASLLTTTMTRQLRDSLPPVSNGRTMSRHLNTRCTSNGWQNQMFYRLRGFRCNPGGGLAMMRK